MRDGVASEPDFGTPFHLKCVELPAAVHFQVPT